jgi:PilZ domain
MGQIAVLPVPEGRKAERRIVNLAARLRDPGASVTEVEVLNLSVDGFMARGVGGLDKGASVWLKLPGLEPQSSCVVWTEEDKAGFEFASPLHPATLELLVATGRKPIRKNHFGPQAAR